jgi:hypothetical protein
MRNTLLLKQAIIIACIDALAGVNIYDHNNQVAKEAVEECTQRIESIDGFKP